VSFYDETFQDWHTRTGELPPDFDQMPSIPFLPDPLMLDEGVRNVPVTNMDQWKEKRAWMKRQLEHYITGTYPPAPDNLQAEVLEEKRDGEAMIRLVELRFGPDHRARLTVEMMIPPGKGPFPVCMTQWNHREWAQVALRRGYVGCVYAGADAKDDTEAYAEIWAGDYDFTRLMRRAFGTFRVIDYLQTLSFIDKDKIGLTGHSRNGDLAFIAAAFDERITAVIPSSGSGMEVPWRYSTNKYDIEDIALLACAQPSWFHPRLRFFIGREHKLPIDQHHFMALIAPRGLMLSCAINERHGNPWASEQAYFSTRNVYRFLGAEENLAIRLRYGRHSISARDMEDYIDFFDYVFGRGGNKPEPRLFYDYSFDKWRKRSGEQIRPQDYPVRNLDDLLMDANGNRIASAGSWQEKKAGIKRNLRWALGEEPAGVTNPGPESLRTNARSESTFGSVIIRPEATPQMRVMPISPYNGFGEMLFGYLYCPADRIDKEGRPTGGKLPVVVYLHEYDYAKGFSSDHNIDAVFRSIVQRGYAVFSYDMLGFGNRIEEGTRFYQRYPRWSKMGKMVQDVRAALDALTHLDCVQREQIYVAGYSLGATVGLYSAALDERIAGVVSIAGFASMRSGTADRGTEGIQAYSHLHGLLPRLGCFVGHEPRVPYDFHEILACIAPRPLLVIAPALDKDAPVQDVQHCADQARKVYSLHGAEEMIQVFSPDDYNRLSDEMLEKTYRWLEDRPGP
jgi:dienelactone hydrolase